MGSLTPHWISMQRLTIEPYSHGVRLSDYSVSTYPVIRDFLRALDHKDFERDPRTGEMYPVLKKRFYGLTQDQQEVFLHRHHLTAFYNHMRDRGYEDAHYNIKPVAPPTPTAATYQLVEGFTPRPHQPPIIEALRDDHYSRSLTLQTGKGKTACALAALVDLGCRTVVMIPPKYFGIWEREIQNLLPDTVKRLMPVAGTNALKALIETALSGDLQDDIFLISSATYRAYIDAYEHHRQAITTLGYPVPPPRFHEAIGAGVQINDEFQDDPGLVFRTDLFTNIQKQIYLSATPYTGSEYVTKMINVMIPEHTACPLPEWDSYIDVIALTYDDPEVKRKDYLTPFKNSYNHARYETRMLKAKRRRNRYFAMVKRIVDGVFIKDREPGQKCLILCATVEFIKELTKYLNTAYPDLKVGMHVSGSDYRKLMANDITVSTIKSSGTGVDIPDLREVIKLHATDSKKDNMQVLGRLRHLKNYPDRSPRLTYLVCHQIPQQIRYYQNKKGHFDGRVKSHRTMRL